MAESQVTPKIILGDAISGIGAEPIRNSLAKYNIHDHGRSAPPNFYLTGVRLGDVVTSDSACGDPIVAANTTIIQITPTQLTLSSNALLTAQCAIKVGTKIIYGCSLTKDSNIVTFTEGFNQHGFVEGDQLLSLATTHISGLLRLPTLLTYPILIRSPFAGYIHRVCVKAVAGSATLSIEFRNDAESFLRRTTSFSATTSSATETLFETQSSSSSTYLNKNDTLGLTVESVAADSLIAYSVYLIKDLAYIYTES